MGTFEHQVQRVTAKAGRAGYGLRRKNPLSHEWALFGANGHQAVISGSLDDLEAWLDDQRTNTSTDSRDGATILRFAPTEQPYARPEEYKEAGAEFRRAAAEWEEAGEPQSGPVFDKLNATRDRYLAAMRSEHANEEDRSLS